MALLTRPNTEEMVLSSYVTVAQGAAAKGVSYHAFMMWLRNHPEVSVARLGGRILVRKIDLEKYIPQGQ